MAEEENKNLDYFSLDTIKEWLRKNPEETTVFTFVEQVEALKIDVELNSAKVETLVAMIRQTNFNMQKTIDTAIALEARQFRRYQAECQKHEGTYRPFTVEEIKGYTEDDFNWPCVQETYYTDSGQRRYRNAFAQIELKVRKENEVVEALLKVVQNEKLEAE